MHPRGRRFQLHKSWMSLDGFQCIKPGGDHLLTNDCSSSVCDGSAMADGGGLSSSPLLKHEQRREVPSSLRKFVNEVLIDQFSVQLISHSF